MLPVADHNVVTLTRTILAFIPHDAIVDLSARFPAIGTALWRGTLVDASVLREWMVNLGRRSAHPQVVHFVCERWSDREPGLADGSEFSWPLTKSRSATRSA